MIEGLVAWIGAAISALGALGAYFAFSELKYLKMINASKINTIINIH